MRFFGPGKDENSAKIFSDLDSVKKADKNTSSYLLNQFKCIENNLIILNSKFYKCNGNYNNLKHQISY